MALVSAVLLLSAGLASEVQASERLTLTAEAGATDPKSGSNDGQLTVAGSNGRYDHLAAAALRLPLRLSAQPASDGENRKILASKLSLKQPASGGTDAVAVNALGAAAPVRSIALSETFEFAAEQQGAIAQNAIALCNGLSATDREKADARRMTMPVPLVWRVRRRHAIIVPPVEIEPSGRDAPNQPHRHRHAPGIGLFAIRGRQSVAQRDGVLRDRALRLGGKFKRL